MGCSNRVAGDMICQGTANIVDRRSVDGVDLVTLTRPAHREFYVNAAPAPDESIAEVFCNIAALLREENACVVSLEVFGVSAVEGNPALQVAFGEPDFPVTWLDEGCESAQPLVGVQAWAVSGLTVTPLRAGGRILGSLFEDGCVRACRLGGLGATDPALPAHEQARAVFHQMASLLEQAGMDFSNVVRTWFYNHRMLDWYGAFNTVRTDFFLEHGVFDGLVPASTGVGGHNALGGALTAGLLALVPRCAEVRTFAIPSPLQCPALAYGSAFNRAVEITLPDHRRLLISGTASIAPEGHTVHLDDVEAQVALTMEVVAAILESRGMSWSDVSRSIAYFKHAKDATVFENYRATEKIPSFPAIVVKEDICRDDLLFEIELDALKGC